MMEQEIMMQQHKSNINENINIASLASGTYIIEVSDLDEKESSAIKLIKYYKLINYNLSTVKEISKLSLPNS